MFYKKALNTSELKGVTFLLNVIVIPHCVTLVSWSENSKIFISHRLSFQSLISLLDNYHTRHQQLSATTFLPELRSFLEQYMNYLFPICRLTKLMIESIINAMKELWAQITDCPGGNSIPMVNRNLRTKFKTLFLVY